MNIRYSALGIALALITSLSAQTSAPQPNRSITAKDIFDFVWVANPELSPDGCGPQ